MDREVLEVDDDKIWIISYHDETPSIIVLSLLRGQNSMVTFKGGGGEGKEKERKKINFSFKRSFVVSACLDNEFYCEDATCIAAELQCNGRVNCRFRWDEEDQSCNVSKRYISRVNSIAILLTVVKHFPNVRTRITAPPPLLAPFSPPFPPYFR